MVPRAGRPRLAPRCAAHRHLPNPRLIFRICGVATARVILVRQLRITHHEPAPGDAGPIDGAGAGCKTFPWVAALQATDPDRFTRICRTVRTDGVYVELS